LTPLPAAREPGKPWRWPATAQSAADELVGSGLRIIFNYSEALLDVPHDVRVHTSNPAVELAHALYFHLGAPRTDSCPEPTEQRFISGNAHAQPAPVVPIEM